MPKCWHCGKQGLFLRLSASGLCMSCLEEAADWAITTLNRLKESKFEREKFCAELDRLDIKDAVKAAGPVINESAFSFWDVAIHFSNEQQDRIKRSGSVILLQYDPESKVAKSCGSNGEVYSTTFSECTCMDFKARQLPCKHMYKLAIQYGNIEPSYLTGKSD